MIRPHNITRIRSTDMPEDEPKILELRQRLDRHLEDYRLHILEHEHREQKLLEAQERNAEQLEQLTKATQGLVDAWNAARTFQKFIKWVTGFSGVAVFIAWYNDFFNIGN